MKWNNDWREKLKKVDNDCYYRLCECRNTRKDVILMAKLVKEYNPNQPSEECLIYMMEWVGDWNGQYMVTDFTKEEYKNAIAEIEDFSKRFTRIEEVNNENNN